MKIGLISPKGDFFKGEKFKEFYDPQNINAHYKDYWTGLGAALLTVAALTPEHHEIELIDENREEVDFSREYDLVGITLMTQQAVRAYEIAHEFQQRGVHVVLGGIHVTSIPDEAQKHGDSIVVGEAEHTWPQLLEDFEKGVVKSRYSSDELADLAKLPMQRIDLLKDKGYNTVWLQTTRGCPHDCEFCVATNVLGRKYRIRPVSAIMEEVDRVIAEFGPGVKLNFCDDNLFANKGFSKELLKELKSRNISWNCQADISIAEDEELLKLMSESGCMLVFIGFESLSGANLSKLNKSGWKYKKLQKYPESIERIQSYGIGVMGGFIVGLPHDTKDTFSEIGSFIYDNMLLDFHVTILTPLPGTRLRERMEKAGELLPFSWEYYTFKEVVFKHPNLSKDELEDGLISIYTSLNTEEFYMKKLEYFRDIFRKKRKREKALK